MCQLRGLSNIVAHAYQDVHVHQQVQSSHSKSQSLLTPDQNRRILGHHFYKARHSSFAYAVLRRCVASFHSKPSVYSVSLQAQNDTFIA